MVMVSSLCVIVCPYTHWREFFPSDLIDTTSEIIGGQKWNTNIQNLNWKRCGIWILSVYSNGSSNAFDMAKFDHRECVAEKWTRENSIHLRTKKSAIIFRIEVYEVEWIKTDYCVLVLTMILLCVWELLASGDIRIANPFQLGLCHIFSYGMGELIVYSSEIWLECCSWCRSMYICI